MLITGNLIAVDPGKHACGVAWFGSRGQLISAELRPHTLVLPDLPSGWAQVCEKPKVYTRERSKADPKDLIDLAIAAGRMTANGKCTYTEPAAWKGQVPKEIHHARVLKELDASEAVLWERISQGIAARLSHNVLDAIALGLHTLGRL